MHLISLCCPCFIYGESEIKFIVFNTVRVNVKTELVSKVRHVLKKPFPSNVFRPKTGRMMPGALASLPKLPKGKSPAATEPGFPDDLGDEDSSSSSSDDDSSDDSFDPTDIPGAPRKSRELKLGNEPFSTGEGVRELLGRDFLRNVEDMIHYRT